MRGGPSASHNHPSGSLLSRNESIVTGGSSSQIMPGGRPLAAQTGGDIARRPGYYQNQPP